MKPNDKAYAAAIKIYNIHSDYDAESVSLRLAVDAAFAAQFPPSEDYAGLIAKLKDDYGFNATDDDCIAAADALGALLAERDRLNGVIQSYQILLETQQGMLVATQTERDALLARLAPVDDDALVEIAVKAMDRIAGFSFNNLVRARAAIAAIRPHIEAAERERCARIADKYEGEWHSDTADACARAIAAAIRSEK